MKTFVEDSSQMVAAVTSGPEGQWFKFPHRQAVKVAETQHNS